MVVRTESSSRSIMRANEIGETPAFQLRQSFIPTGRSMWVENMIANLDVESGDRVNNVPSEVSMAHTTDSGDGVWSLTGHNAFDAVVNITQPRAEYTGYGSAEFEFWLWTPSFPLFDVSAGAQWEIAVPVGQSVAISGYVVDKVQFLSNNVYLKLAARAVIHSLSQWQVKLGLKCGPRQSAQDFYGYQRCVLTYASSIARPLKEPIALENDDDDSVLSDISFLFDE